MRIARRGTVGTPAATLAALNTTAVAFMLETKENTKSE
jgi:hypothetical protein